MLGPFHILSRLGRCNFWKISQWGFFVCFGSVLFLPSALLWTPHLGDNGGFLLAHLNEIPNHVSSGFHAIILAVTPAELQSSAPGKNFWGAKYARMDLLTHWLVGDLLSCCPMPPITVTNWTKCWDISSVGCFVGIFFPPVLSHPTNSIMQQVPGDSTVLNRGKCLFACMSTVCQNLVFSEWKHPYVCFRMIFCYLWLKC